MVFLVPLTGRQSVQLRGAVLAALLSIVAVGCSNTVSLKPPVFVPVIEAAPVSVVVKYSDKLRDHACVASKGYITASWSFALGPPSIEMFNTVFAALFKEVQFLDTASKMSVGPDKRDVIELQLSDFTGCDASWPILDTTDIDIAYKAIARNTKGEELLQWEGRGRATNEDLPQPYTGTDSDLEGSHLAALTKVAMRKAAANFIINFESVRESVPQWTRKQLMK